MSILLLKVKNIRISYNIILQNMSLTGQQKTEEAAGSSKNTSTVTFLQTTGILEFSPDKESWFIWKERLDIHFCEVNCTEENSKKAVLLKSIGAEAYSVLHSLCSPESPVSKTFNELCDILSVQYTPPTIVFYERKKFHSSKKHDGETVAEWFARVKKLALNCKFGGHLEAFVLDQFIIGLPNEIFERLCEEDEKLTLSEALRKALIMETKRNTKTVTKVEVKEEDGVNYVKKGKNRPISSKFSGSKEVSSRNNENGGSSSRSKRSNKPCSHCGWRNHQSNVCKFQDSKCHSCGKIGHLASICRSKSQKSVNYVSDSDEKVQCESNNYFNYSIFSIATEDSNKIYKLPVVIDGVKLNIACDTGAPCTLVPVSFYKKNKVKKDLRPCQVPYVDYSGDRIQLLGEYDAIITYEGNAKSIVVVVSNTESPPLLGRSFLRAFNFELMQVNLIKKDNYSIVVQEIKNEFSEVFSDRLGEYNISKVSLSIHSDAKPIFFKPRPLPLAWKDKVENQLRDLIKKGVLEQIDNSEWGTPLVPILKPNGDLRLCGDYKVTINKYLVDFKYPLPRIDEIFASLQGGELFTKLDLSNAYNQLLLDENSQLLCAWSTHIGTLKMKRMPFGIKTAAAVFQKTMENLLREVPSVVVYQDDITVTGRDIQQHIRNLKLVLSKLKSAGLKLNSKKCQFFQKKISYLGFSIDKYGLSKNDERIASVNNAPVPTNVSEVRAFAGMVNYYSKFINNFAKKMSPLYNLLQKNVKFQWSQECQKAYEIMKAEVTSDQVLVHFNPALPVVLTTDACSNAVAGILSHRFHDSTERPIAFVSRALNNTEKNYSTLEKEALAIIFGVTKLKQYLLGNKFMLRTDHKPLLTIFGENKGLPIMASARMQRWALILSGFNYTVEYIKGTLNDADSLSRMPQSVAIDDYKSNSYINFVESENCLHLNFKDIARETRRDPILSKLSDAIQKGMVSKLSCDKYNSFRNKELELTVEYDCVLWGYRTVVPEKLRKQIIDQLHTSHLGIVKTKALARSYVWWPGLDRDIEIMVRNCGPCQELQSSPEKSALIPWKPTDSVWSRIHVDFAGPINNYYMLVVIDSFSKWTEVFKTKEITSAFTIGKLRELFCRYGLVDTLVSDNGRQFTSGEFKQFLENNGVKHILTAPGHPATNGQAENFIKTLKKSILANLKIQPNAGVDTIINRFLVDYRNIRHCTTGESPAKLFFGRSLKTRFSALKPPLTIDKILESQAKSVLNHKGKRNVNFTSGQKVLVRDYKNPNKSSWSPATINKQLGSRSYLCILTHNNRQIKRHLDQIRKQNTNCIINDSTSVLGTAGGENDSSKFTTPTGGEDQSCSHIPVRDDQVDQETPRRQLRPRYCGKVVKKDGEGVQSRQIDFDKKIT